MTANRCRANIPFALAILFFASAALADGVYTCANGIPGAPWNSCAEPLKCLDKLPSDQTLVRALGGNQNQNHILQRWSALAANGIVRTCRVSDNAALDWNSKALSGVTVGSAPPPPQPPVEPPPAAEPVVSIGDTLWLTQPIDGAVSYRVYHGTTSGQYAAPITVAATRYPLQGYPPGTHYFAMAAVNAQGDESWRSPEMIYQVPQPPAVPPPKFECRDPNVTGLTVELSCSVQ